MTDRAGDIVWSTNKEDFTSDTKEEAIENKYVYVDGVYTNAKAGDKLYYGTVQAIQSKHLVDADDVIDMLAERAYDLVGEYADNYPQASTKEVKLLDNYLKKWVEKYCKPSFYNIVDIQEYIITEEDIKDNNNE